LRWYATTPYASDCDGVNRKSTEGARSLEVVVEPRITDDRWYLAANPAFADGIEVATLAGAPAGGPTIETRVGFDIDGTELKAREDFTAAAVGWQGLVLTPSAP
jgi:hypothetical protein